MDINKFARSLHIKKYMMNKPGEGITRNITEETDVVYSNLRNKSVFKPPISNDGHIEAFRRMVLKDLYDMKIKRISDPGDIKNGIRKLEERNDVVVRPADKGGAIVVQSKVAYKKEIDRQLSDNTTYLKLPGNPIIRYKDDLAKLVERGTKKDLLNKKEAKYLQPVGCKIPVLYTLPKIHKSRDEPPGRPIVNGINSVGARIGEYIDWFLQPLVKKTESYLRDTKHLIQLLDTISLDGNTVYLATADVSSLYTIINHKEAVQATNWALNTLSDLKNAQKKFISNCLEYSLDHNYFWYGNEYYKQICGIAMGAKYAPSVANLYMAEWEAEVLYNRKPQQLLLYRRFIDDILIIWDGDKESLIDFGFYLNSNDKNIKLTWELSDEKINFLDLEITKEGTKLVTQTHFKTVDRNSYLPLDSCHHNPWLENIPKGQLLRLRRNCTKTNVFLEQADFIGKRFIEKGYKPDFIEKKIKDVVTLDRDTLIQDSVRNSSFTGKIPLIMDYSVQHKQIEAICKKYWHIVKADRHLAQVLPEKTLFTYRRAPTLRDIIAKNVLDPPEKKVFHFLMRKGTIRVKNALLANAPKRAKRRKRLSIPVLQGNNIKSKNLSPVRRRG